MVLKTYGIVGVLILLPVAASLVLWRQNLKLHDEVVSQTNKAVEAERSRVGDQQQRVADTERMMGKLLDVVKEQAQLNTSTNGILERLSETVEKLERQLLAGGRG